MAISLLDHFVLTQLFAFLLLFARLGATVMVLPGIGDMFVSPRIRLLLALSLCLLLTPLLQDRMPAMPSSPISLTVILITETTIGLALGMVVRIMLAGMHVAGTIIAAQASLSVASMFDLGNNGQSTVVSNFLTLMSLVIFFQLNLDHMVFQGLVASYDLFPPTEAPNMEDLNELTARAVGDAFMMGTQLAAPHIVFGLIFYLGGGVMARLMPQMQVFYVLMSAQILIAFFLIIVILSSMMFIYTGHVSDSLNNLFFGG